MAKSIPDVIQSMAYDLCNIEVSTVIKDGITARKMPEPAHALLDIAKKYFDFLRQRFEEIEGAKLRTKKETEAGDPKFGGPFKSKGSETGFDLLDGFDRVLKTDTFDNLRNAALAIRPLAKGSEPVIIDRIVRNCDQIKGLFENLSERGIKLDDDKEEINRSTLSTNKSARDKLDVLKLRPDETVLIRKIWELGTEEVLMKTVIQLDGDIVTRIQRDFETDEHHVLHAIHFDTVKTSMDHWRFIVKTLVKFATTSLASIFKGK